MARLHRALAIIFIFALTFPFAPAQLQTAHAATPDITLVVNSASDPYPSDNVCSAVGVNDGCTLRDAIMLANAADASKTIQINFNIARGVPGYTNESVVGFNVETWTIQLTQALPFIDHDNVTVDGTSQENYITGQQNPFGPTVVINGSNIPTNSSGLTIRSNNNVIKNLGIINFVGTPGVGIDIRSRSVGGVVKGDNNTVQGCYLGIDKLGTTAAPNNYGVWIRSSNNLVGGQTSLQGQQNVISGNKFDGVRIEDGTGNKIQANYIGLNAPGTAAVPNQGNGIYIYVSESNVIGSTLADTDATHANVISGNASNGVSIMDSNTNSIAGNLIGLSTTGSDKIPNGNDGVRIETSGNYSLNNKIGDATTFTRNVISGNGGIGIHLIGDNVSGTQIVNNLVGLTATGMGLTGNTQAGVVVNGADNTTVGGITQGQGNIISGNTGDAISIIGKLASNETSSNSYIYGNTIGLNEARTTTIGNTGNGISISGSVKTVVVGGTGAASNVIGGNDGDGVQIIGATNLSVLGNAIGLFKTALPNAFATSAPNSGNGIVASGVKNLQIGGSTPDLGNVIGANGGHGISVTSAVSSTIQYNQIGGTIIGTTTYAIGNSKLGLSVVGSGDPRVLPVATTVTSGTIIKNNSLISNGQGGISLTEAYTTTVDTNVISQNDGTGIAVTRGFNVATSKNTIASNSAYGVQVQGGAQRVSVLDSSITGNTNKGIELVDETTSTTGNAANSNHDINPPFNLHLNEAKQVTGRVLVTKVANVPVPAACIGCIIQFFAADPSTLDGQGRDKIATTNLTISANGYFTATLATLPKQLAVTATDTQGNTSEYALLTVDPKVDIEVIGTKAKLAGPSETISYTLRVTNTGTLDLTDLKLLAKSDKGWDKIKVEPAGLSLKAAADGLPGQSSPVTLTITLPDGVDRRVRIPTMNTTYVTVTSTLVPTATDSIAVTTGVTSKFVLQATPKSTTGSGVTLNPPPAKSTTVPYNIALLNTGNLTGTVTITASTSTIDGNFAEWDTTLTTTTVTLPPGITKTPAVNVAIPYGALAGTQAQATIVISSPLLLKPITITTTTTVAQDQRATIGYDSEGPGAAGLVAKFLHQVTNIGNTPAKFKLDAGSSLGSTIKFVSEDNAKVPIAADGTFTLGTAEDPMSPPSSVMFYAEVTVSSRAYRGDKDVVTITLSDESGSIIGGVQDTITVTQSAMVPRIYLPLAIR